MRINVRLNSALYDAVKQKIRDDAAGGRAGKSGRWNLTALLDEAMRAYVGEGGDDVVRY